MSNIFKAACIQLNCGPDLSRNLKDCGEIAADAASKGAKFILTPENTDFLVKSNIERRRLSLPEKGHPGLSFASGLAQELEAWLLIGSMSIDLDDGSDRIANRSFLFDAKGGIVARYDKIHTFDITLPNGEAYRESAVVRPGGKAVTAPLPWGMLGMSICYDLRFAYLYRALAKAGAIFLAVPSAFTVPTGRAHWETLLRARAIETGSFIFAPDQTGDHEEQLETYGHSLIIGPWGDVLSRTGDETGYILADINQDDALKAREAIPSLQHDRSFS
jgi:predicted amidohydrolase